MELSFQPFVFSVFLKTILLENTTSGSKLPHDIGILLGRPFEWSEKCPRRFCSRGMRLKSAARSSSLPVVVRASGPRSAGSKIRSGGPSRRTPQDPGTHLGGNPFPIRGTTACWKRLLERPCPSRRGGPLGPPGHKNRSRDRIMGQRRKDQFLNSRLAWLRASWGVGALWAPPPPSRT